MSLSKSWIDEFPGNFMWSNATLVTKGMARYGAVALGATTLARDPAIPDVPTIAESGVPGYQAAEWQGIVVRAGTPAAVVTRLNQEIVRSLKAPDLAQRFAAVGAQAVGSTLEGFAEHIRRERESWAKVIQAAGIRIE